MNRLHVHAPAPGAALADLSYRQCRFCCTDAGVDEGLEAVMNLIDSPDVRAALRSLSEELTGL
jgi:hypothetical protein